MEHLLKDADSEHEFVLGSKRIKNLEDLVSVLKQISDEEFSFYVNENKNDFSTWIGKTIKDEELAEDLIDCHSRDETINCIESRIEWIKYEVEHKNSLSEKNAAEKNTEETPMKKTEPEELKSPDMKSQEPFQNFESFKKNKINEEKHESKNEEARYPKRYVFYAVREFLFGLIFGIFIGIILSKLLSFI